jgi:hypothetical protein
LCNPFRQPFSRLAVSRNSRLPGNPIRRKSLVVYCEANGLELALQTLSPRGRAISGVPGQETGANILSRLKNGHAKIHRRDKTS